jgi:hypothetical protein
MFHFGFHTQVTSDRLISFCWSSAGNCLVHKEMCVIVKPESILYISSTPIPKARATEVKKHEITPRSQLQTAEAPSRGSM